MEEAVIGPSASPQTGIPWQYWWGSQGKVPASTAPMPLSKSISHGTRLLVQLWRKASESTNDNKHLQGCPWKTYPYSPVPRSQSNWLPSPCSFTWQDITSSSALLRWKNWAKPNHMDRQKRDGAPSTLLQNEVLRDCVPVLKEHRMGLWIPGKKKKDKETQQPGQAFSEEQK